MSLRIVFMGTPELAATSLSALLASDHEVVGVVSQPARPAGRGKRVTQTPVATVAEHHGLALVQPDDARGAELRAWVEALAPDVGVVAAYGHILGPRLLAAPRLGCLNVHASLLPRWRGASPIQAAIAAGDAETGVTIMQMDRGMDTGAMLLVRRTPISADDTAQTLHDRLAGIGAAALVEALELLEADALPPTPQDHGQATYTRLIGKDDADVDWSAPAATIERRMRAHHPWPGTRTWHDGQPLKLLPPAEVVDAAGSAAPGEILAADADGVVVAAGEGALRLKSLQAPGRRPLAAADFLRGYALTPGMRLGARVSGTA